MPKGDGVPQEGLSITRHQTRLSQLLAEKSALENKLAQLESQIHVSMEHRSLLDNNVLELLTAKEGLEEEIKTKKEIASDLDERKSERDQVMLQLDDMQMKIQQAGKRWVVLPLRLDV